MFCNQCEQTAKGEVCNIKGNVLVEKFGIKPIGNPDEDIAAILGEKLVNA